MTKPDVPIASKFVPAKYDYGSRPFPTLAFVVHMAEGYNVADYLSRGNIARGVSVHFTVESGGRYKDGEVVQMLTLAHASGSINPGTIRTDDDPSLFGASHAKAVMGAYWKDPNKAVISVEVAGRAADGPTPKQVASLVALFDQLRKLHPKIVPLGHRDFQNVKRCPGKTPAIRQMYRDMGGHGTDYRKPVEARYMSTRQYVPDQLCDITLGAKIYDFPDGPSIGVSTGDTERSTFGTSPGGDYRLISSELDGKTRTVWIGKTDTANLRLEVPVKPNCDTAVEQALAAQKVRLDELEVLRDYVDAAPVPADNPVP